MLIAVEGINGANKTKYALEYATFIKAEYIKFPCSKEMLLYLNNEYNQLEAQVAELSIYLHYYNLYKNKDVNVVLERGYFSLYAYFENQSFENFVKSNIKPPELCILLTVNKYIPKTRKLNNRFLNDAEFQMKVQDKMIKDFYEFYTPIIKDYIHNNITYKFGIRKDIFTSEAENIYSKFISV
ncbi:MAG: hypothetical protein QXT65_04470 [Candidatus Nitrosocaldaceae archaeon]